MTIKTRNNILLVLIFVSLCLILSSAIITLFKFYTHDFAYPEYIPYTKFQDYTITQFHFTSVIISVFVLLLYSCVSLLYINIGFEKTQSTEIIYFSVFLLGCFNEAFRLLFPILNIWHNGEILQFFASRVILCGRIITPMSLLFATIYSNPEHRQYVEQNIALIIILSVITASIFPLNTQRVLPVCRFDWGLRNQFYTIQFLTFGSSILSDIVKNLKSTNSFKFPWSMLLISIGYVCLCDTMNYALLISGTLFLLGGTYMYLKELHSTYLWNDI